MLPMEAPARVDLGDGAAEGIEFQLPRRHTIPPEGPVHEGPGADLRRWGRSVDLDHV